MADPTPRSSRISRESRLLLLTVGLCALVLLVLARWRFPDREEAPTTAPPLERLAARAPYEALAVDIQRVEPMIAPNLVVLRVAPSAAPAPRGLADVLARADAPSDVRHVAALRIGADTALCSIPPGARIDGIVGGGEAAGQASVLATDLVRGLSRIRVPTSAVRSLPQLAIAAVQTPGYIVAVEGTHAGMTIRPVFVGRGHPFASARWSRPLLPLGGLGVSPGALMFSLAGEFIGTAVIENGAPAIAGARDVIDSVDRLTAENAVAPASLGIAVQPLTRALAAALGVKTGVVVSDVDPNGPAAAKLQPGDVIAAIDDWSTADPDALLMRIAARRPGERVTIRAIRSGAPLTATAALTAMLPDAAAETPFTFAVERNVGVRVTAAPPASGLQPGDVITRAGSVEAPTPIEMRRILSRSTPTGFVVLVIRREGRQQIVPIAVTPPTDAAR